MATQRKVEFQGTFNIQEILSAVDALQNRLNRIQLDDSSARRFERTFADLKKRAQEIDAEIKQGFTNTSQINNFNNHLQKLGQQMEILKGEIGRIDTSFSNLQLSPNLQKQFENLKNSANTMFDAYENQISSIENKISSFANKTGVSFDQTEISGLAEAISSSEKLAKLQEEKQASLQQERADIQATISAREESLKQAEQEVILARQNQEAIAAQLVAQKEKIASMRGEGADTASLQKQIDIQKDLTVKNNEALDIVRRREKVQEEINGDLKAEKAYLSKVESSIENITKFFNGLKGDSSGLDDDAAAAAKEFADLSSKVAQLEKQLEAANAELQKFKDLQAQKATSGLDKSADDIGKLKDNIDDASNSTSGLSDNLEKLNKQDEFFNNLRNRATAIFGLTNAFIYMNRFIRESVNAIKELDAAFTEIAVVTEKTTSQLWESFNVYNQMAQRLGTTTVDAIQTSALYYQQGLDTVEVLELTEETMKMARIAGMDYAEATDRMTAALRGFKLEMSEASRVNDVFSALAAESAVDTDELSYALTKTASIAQSAGMELETTSAFLSQMIETTREAPENIGTAMKTIIARFQELKSAVGDSVEIDGELVDVNKVDTALKSVGVQLRDSLTGQFRDLDDVFLELASKWDTLDRNTQRYVATIAAGSRQQSRFIAMMDNYERTVELVDIAQNSSGASAIQFGKTLDSLEAKTNKIKASFEEFIGLLIGSDFVKGILEASNNVLQMINDIAEKGPVAVAAFGTFFIITIKKIISNFIASAKTVSAAFSAGWSEVGGSYGSSMKKANENAIRDLENRIKNSKITQLIKQKVEDGVKQGYNGGVAGSTSTPVGTQVRANTRGANVVAKQGQKINKTYLNQIYDRLQKGESVSKADRAVLRAGGISAGKNNKEFAENIKNYKEVNTGLKGFKQNIANLNPVITQTISSLASLGSMAIMTSAATTGTASLEGATTGNMIGSGIGAAAGAALAAVGIPPQIGMALGSSLGGLIGTFAGKTIGETLDNMNYGIGSESSINKLKKQAEQIANESNKVIEKNSGLVDAGEEYLELSEKMVLTNEERDRMIELNKELINQYPELAGIYDSEISSNTILIEQLKERIALAKEENTLANARSDVANKQLEYAQNSRESQKNREKLREDAESSQYEWYELVNDIAMTLPTLGLNWIGANARGQNRQDTAYKYFDDRQGKDVSSMSYKEYLSEFESGWGGGKALTEDQFNEYLTELKNQQDSLEAYYDNFRNSLQGFVDSAFEGLDVDSFAYKNKDLISNLAKNLVSDEEIKTMLESGLSSDEIVENIQATADNVTSRLIPILNNFGVEGQDIFNNALSMIGLYRDETTKEIDMEPIYKYLKDNLGLAGEQLSTFFKENLTEEQIQNLGKRYDKLLEKNQGFIDQLTKDYGQVAALQFGQIAANMNQDETSLVGAFQDNFENILKNYENSQEIFAELGKANLESGVSMSQLQVKLGKLGVAEDDIIGITSSMGRTFEQSGYTASESLEYISSNLETIDDLLEMIDDNAEGLSLEQFNKLNKILKDAGQNMLKLNDLMITAEGVTVKEGVGSIVGQGVSAYTDIYDKMAEKSYAAMIENQMLASSYEALSKSDDLDERNIGLQKLGEYTEIASENEQAYMNYVIASAQTTLRAKQAEADRAYNQIQNYKKMIAEMERYYNIQRHMLELQNRQEEFQLDMTLASNPQEVADSFNNQILNLIEQQELLKKAGDIYQKDMTEWANYINSSYGKYLSVDADGIIQENSQELINLAKRMEGASEGEAEQLQKQWDTIQEVKQAYEEMYDAANQNIKDYKQNLIDLEKIERARIDKVVSLHQYLRNVILDNMKKEVDETKKKYDKIKSEDQKYLNSLQQNINKRKQLQQDEKQDKDIDTLQKRIGLLSRDTSGIYAKELEDLQAELDEKLQEKSNTALDRLYEQEQQKTQMVADELTLRGEYLQSQLDYEYETHKISNERLNELMGLSHEELLGWMQKNDATFISMTKEEQAQFNQDYGKMIDEAKGAQQSMTTNLEEQKNAIIGKFDEIITGGINEYERAIDKANKKQVKLTLDASQFEKKLDEVKNKYMDLYKLNARAGLDQLLSSIYQASASGDQATVKSLSAQYKTQLDYLSGLTDGDTKMTEDSAYYDKISSKDYANALDTVKGLGNTEWGKVNQEEYISNLPSGTEVELKATKSGKIPLYNEDGSYAKDFKDPIGHDVETNTSGEAKKINGVWMVRTDETGLLYVPLTEIQTPGSWGSSEKWSDKKVVKKRTKAFETGGLVNYTGPAWVDGTKTRPEAFLSAADTANIAKLRDILSKVFDSNSSSSNTPEQNQNTGDTYYEFHINVDELSEDYSAKDMMADMEKYIIQKSNYRNVINIGKRR